MSIFCQNYNIKYLFLTNLVYSKKKYKKYFGQRGTKMYLGKISINSNQEKLPPSLHTQILVLH